MVARQYSNPLDLPSSPSWVRESDRHLLSQFLSVATVMPEQFHNEPGSQYRQGPEARLMQAVLEDAVWCFQQQFLPSCVNGRRLAREAEWWFFKDTSDSPFSFVQICTVLGLEPEYLRRGLQRWYLQRPVDFQRSKRRATSKRPLTWRATTYERPASSDARDSPLIDLRSLLQGGSAHG